MSRHKISMEDYFDEGRSYINGTGSIFNLSDSGTKRKKLPIGFRAAEEPTPDPPAPAPKKKQKKLDKDVWKF